MAEHSCPCGSEKLYADCCALLHEGISRAADAEKLMRSRYSAYVLQEIDYIVETTVPAQHNLLGKDDMMAWSRETEWLGLDVLNHVPRIGKHHAQVEFIAHFAERNETRQHRELSAFVEIGGNWYFIDPTVPLPAMKQPCICGSGKKFKACCGQFFK